MGYLCMCSCNILSLLGSRRIDEYIFLGYRMVLPVSCGLGGRVSESS